MGPFKLDPKPRVEKTLQGFSWFQVAVQDSFRECAGSSGGALQDFQLLGTLHLVYEKALLYLSPSHLALRRLFLDLPSESDLEAALHDHRPTSYGLDFQAFCKLAAAVLAAIAARRGARALAFAAGGALGAVAAKRAAASLVPGGSRGLFAKEHAVATPLLGHLLGLVLAIIL